jgi:hypothetical protein
VPCLRLVEAFDNGEELLAAVARHRLEGIVGKRRSSTYGSGPSSKVLDGPMVDAEGVCDLVNIATARWQREKC